MQPKKFTKIPFWTASEQEFQFKMVLDTLYNQLNPMRLKPEKPFCILIANLFNQF